MDEFNYLRQRQRKIEKHYPIMINDKPAKILNYKFEEIINSHSKEKETYIELITKISNSIFRSSKVKMTIVEKEKKIEISGVYIGSVLSLGLFRHKYRIDEFIEI